MRRFLLPLSVFSFLWMAAPASATLLFSLDPSNGAVTGDPGSTVGWGFTLTDTTSGEWILINSAEFISATSTGTFTGFGFPQVIGSGTGNFNPYTEAFDPIQQTGVGEYVIDSGAAPGSVASGEIVLSYSSYSADPTNDPNFNPDTDLIAANLTVSQAASVTVPGEAPTPEPASALFVAAGLALLATSVRRIRN